MNAKYHLAELKISLDASHPGHTLPPPRPATDAILDIGCGVGQTLIAAYGDLVTFGLDVDLGALKLGRSLSENVRFVCGKAEALPYRDQQFDMVVVRASLPYFNIHASLREIRRVLRPGGAVWMTLHPISIPWKAAKTANFKGRIFFAYICLNSILFHFSQRQFALLGRCESFQTAGGIARALRQVGFLDITITRASQFQVTATKSRSLRKSMLRSWLGAVAWGKSTRARTGLIVDSLSRDTVQDDGPPTVAYLPKHE
jgi:ubiquinone/menaquinone biosynthesis C-methylase UbiE